MRKSRAFWLPALVCLPLFVGCKGGGAGREQAAGPGPSGGEDVERLVADLNSFTDELVKKIESAQDPASGVGEAQRLLDARKAELASRIDAARRGREFRESGGARGKMLESEVDNTDRVAGLRTRQYLDLWMRDPEFKARLDKFVADYQALFKE